MLAALLLAQAGASAAAAPTLVPGDPLRSPFLPDVLQLVLPEGAEVRFDDRVKVMFPGIAEDQRQFPVQVDARGVGEVKRIIIFADLNPIQTAVEFTPHAAEPFIAVRIKLDQATPVRAAVETADGRWLLAGGLIDAAGGGCSAPPVSRASGDWARALLTLRARRFEHHDGTRLMISLRHPMDTGFVDNIPSYWLEQVRVHSDGVLLAEIALQASVAEDPAIMLMPKMVRGAAIRISARDTGGEEMAATLAGQSAIPPERQREAP